MHAQFLYFICIKKIKYIQIGSPSNLMSIIFIFILWPIESFMSLKIDTLDGYPDGI